MTDEYKIGDKVKIVKRKPLKGDMYYTWEKEMNVFNGKEAVIIGVYSGDKEDGYSYDLSIDSGIHGFMHHWLDKIDKSE